MCSSDLAQIMILKNKKDIYSLNNQKIDRTFIKDKAYETLCQWIITGELQPNTKLRVNELSELLGVSRTPVREALLRLEDDGLIITKANRWTIVAPINLDDSVNIYSVILSLETLALRQAFPKIKKTDLKELEFLNEKIITAIKNENYLEILKADNDFHNKIIELSGNNEIFPIIDSLKKRVQRIELYFFKNVHEKKKSYEEHKIIIDALKDGNLEKSLEGLNNNWKNDVNLYTDESLS